MQSGRRGFAVPPALFAAAALAVVMASPTAGLAKAKASHKPRPAAARATSSSSSSASYSLKPLSPRDARDYTAAFAAVRRGEFELADTLAKGVDNPLLKGRLAY